MEPLVKDGKKQVILLSSTEDPYFRDILDLMFYPSSIDYRFRYHRTWVSKELKNDNDELSKEKIDGLNEKEAILIHVLTEKNNSTYSIKELLPIRKATIKEAKIIGDFLWINFTLGDWISYKKLPSATKINEHHDNLQAHFNFETNDIKNKLVFLAKEITLDTIPDTFEIENTEMLHNWSRIANHISRLSQNRRDTGKVIFMKFIRIKDTTKDQILNVTTINDDKPGFELKSEHSYTIEIVEYTDQKIKPFGLEMKTQAETISPNNETIEIRGKYDVLLFAFSCKRTKVDTVSTVKFTSKDQPYVTSKPFFWIKVKTQKWAYVGFPLVGFALSTLFASEQFFNIIFGQATNYGILVFGVAGTLLSTISLFYLRK